MSELYNQNRIDCGDHYKYYVSKNRHYESRMWRKKSVPQCNWFQPGHWTWQNYKTIVKWFSLDCSRERLGSFVFFFSFFLFPFRLSQLRCEMSFMLTLILKPCSGVSTWKWLTSVSQSFSVHSQFLWHGRIQWTTYSCVFVVLSAGDVTVHMFLQCQLCKWAEIEIENADCKRNINEN